MKSTFFLCVIFVLAACYSCSPVAKEVSQLNQEALLIKGVNEMENLKVKLTLT